MLHIGSYSAWVSMDGVASEIHAPVYDPIENSGSCWIASEAGKKFAVNWRSAYRDLALHGVVTIDGVECDNHVMLDAPRYPNRPQAIGVSFARTSDYTRRDFMFSAINVTDSDEYLHTVDAVYNFGVIQLDLYQIDVKHVVSKPLEHQHGRPVLEGQIVHERSKKAGTHHVKFGEEYVSPQPIIDLVHGVRISDRPFISFTFRYRPLAMLMANGIVPRPTNQSLDEQRRAEEIRNLEARLNSLRSQEVSLPRRKASRTTRIVKSEPEIIDLTDL